MFDRLLQLILQYKMPKDEAFAFRLALIYLELTRRFFPDYKHYGLPKKGDPRRSELFKYCWKMMHENEGKLNPDEYRNFIQAQMSILSNIKIGEGHPFIHPNCLVGKKAWNRWLVWKKYFNEVKKISEPKPQKKDISREIKRALEETHYALTTRLDALTEDKVLEAMPLIVRLVNMHVITPYFLILHPKAIEYLEAVKPNLHFNKESYHETITQEVVDYFQLLFKS